MPSPEEMYPPGYDTWVDVGELGRRLEGEFRPGHFRGVATVCLKLFNIVRPSRAYFGQKDAQQAAVVKQLVGDLNLDLEIRVLPTVRDEDGLALSIAQRVPLSRGARGGARSSACTRNEGSGHGPRAAPGLEVDYLEVAELDGQRVLAAAVHVGDTRLIDNVVLDLPCQDSSWLGRAKKGEDE